MDNFIIEVEYNKKEETLYVGSEDGSGAKYHCKNLKEVKNALLFYIQNYLSIPEEDINPESDKDVSEASEPQASQSKVSDGKTYFLNKRYIYSFDNDNSSKCVVELIRFLDDERGVAEARFTEVIADDSGNGYFSYLHKTGKTMNVSLKYLHEI